MESFLILKDAFQSKGRETAIISTKNLDHNELNQFPSFSLKLKISEPDIRC